jgi:hypothetical protein
LDDRKPEFLLMNVPSRNGGVAAIIRPKIKEPRDRLCGLMVRVPGYTTEMYCDSCEVRTEFIHVM